MNSDYRDKADFAVPAALAAVWRGRDSIENAVNTLRFWTEYMYGDQHTAALEALAAQLAEAEPAYVCPCDSEFGCRRCHKKRWMNMQEAMEVSSLALLPISVASPKALPKSAWRLARASEASCSASAATCTASSPAETTPLNNSAG